MRRFQATVLSLLLFGFENVFTTWNLIDMLCVVKGDRLELYKTHQHKSMNQSEQDASKRMYIHRQVTSKIGGGITYHLADPIDYGTPTIRALGGILLRAETLIGDLPTGRLLDC